MSLVIRKVMQKTKQKISTEKKQIQKLTIQKILKLQNTLNQHQLPSKTAEISIVTNTTRMD